MTQEDPAPQISDLVYEFLERLEVSQDSPSKVLDGLCARYPGMAEPLREAVVQLAGTGLMKGDERGNSSEDEIRLGPFLLGRRLGSGGMGVVHLAWRDGEERPIALKLLRPDLRSEAEAASRFDREIEVAERLDHPNIVRVLDRGALEGGQPFLAMEFHAGGTLDRVVTDCREAQEAPSSGADMLRAIGVEVDPLEVPRTLRGAWWEAVIRVVREVARALSHAHAQGVVHRDVKPSNVLLTPAGRVLLLDFGLATLRGAGRLTATGAQLGSLPYMSPEQVRGDRVIDVRTDVYSLGVAAYELVTLLLPFDVDEPGRLAIAIEKGGAPRPSSRLPHLPSEVAGPLDAVLACAMHVDPSRRYPSVDAFAADLTALIQREPVVARPESSIERVARWVRREPFAAATAGLVALGAVGAPIAYGVIERRHSAEMERGLDATLGHFSSLLDAVDQSLFELADGPLAGDPVLAEARLRATDRALTLLEEVERDGEDFLTLDDERSREAAEALELSRAQLLLSRGDALYANDLIPEALAAYADHERYVRARLSDDPDDPWAVAALGTVRAQEARALKKRSLDDPQAMAALNEALACFERVLALDPDDTRVAGSLAATLLMEVDAANAPLEPDERLIRIERALELIEPLAARPDAAPPTLRRYAEALWLLVEVGTDVDDLEARLPALAHAQDAMERALSADPRNAYVRLIAARLDREHALTLQLHGREPEAVPYAVSARERLESLAAERPDEGVYREHLEHAVELEAYLAAGTGDLDRGLDGLRRALEAARVRAGEAPHDTALRSDVARALLHLASRLKDAGAEDSSVFLEAEAASSEAIEIFDELLDREPSEHNELMRRVALSNRAVIRARHGVLDGALEDAERMESLVAPGDARGLIDLADSYGAIHCALLDAGAPDEEVGEARARTLDAIAAGLDAGFPGPQRLRDVPSFEGLVGDPRFEELLGPR
ncbi:MAG: protein kinase [Planctomycetota bacterium]